MKRSLASFTVCCIFLWIMPLGSFIKPSQEKTACDGRRAFHMCTIEFSQVKKDPGPQKISFTSASGVEHQPKSAASGSQDFSTNDGAMDLLNSASRLLEAYSRNFYQSELPSVFHPPKQLLLF